MTCIVPYRNTIKSAVKGKIMLSNICERKLAMVAKNLMKIPAILFLTYYSATDFLLFNC